MPDLISVFKSSPATTFVMGAERVAQSQANNTTTVRVYIKAVVGPGGNTTSRFLNYGEQWAIVDGIGAVGVYSANPFMPSGYPNGAERWIRAYDVIIGHDANGNMGGITIRMRLNYGSIAVNEDYTAAFTDFPRIPKPPAGTTPLSLDQITPTSMRYRFAGNGDGGSPITGWQVQYSLDSAHTVGMNAFYGTGTDTISGLQNHTTYYVRSRGLNAIGWGPWSGNLSATTTGHPSTPLQLLASPSPNTAGAVNLSWVQPSVTGAGGIVGYTIYRDGQMIATRTGTGTGYTDTGRTPYVTHSYQVAARNAYSTSVSGTGPLTAGYSVVVPGPPSAPRNLTAVSDSVTSGKVNLSWTAPLNIGNGGITGYRIRLADGTLIANQNGTATTYSATGLTPGIAYTFKVSARNALSDAQATESEFSNQVLVTPIGEPDAPTGLTAAPNPLAANRITLNWTAPVSAVSGYSIFQQDVSTGVFTLIGKVNASHTTFHVDGQPSGPVLRFHVRARTFYTDTLANGYPGNWGGPASAEATAVATNNTSQPVASVAALTSVTNAIFNGTYVINQVTANTVRYAKTAANITSSQSGGTISDLTNAVFNGQYTIGTPTAKTLTYAKTNANIVLLGSSGGLVTDTTNVAFNATATVTAVNVGANTISYANTGSTIAAVAVPVNVAPGQSGAVTNLSNAVFNGTGKIITAVTENTLSYAQANANVAESNAAGVVTDTTNRDVFNGTYTVSSIPAYNIVQYARTGTNVPLRTWLTVNGEVSRVTSPSLLDVRFRSGWSG